jgi:hypothetical protein
MHEKTVSLPPLLPVTTPPNMATSSPQPKETVHILPFIVDTHTSHPLNTYRKWNLCGAFTTLASPLGAKL